MPALAAAASEARAAEEGETVTRRWLVRDTALFGGVYCVYEGRRDGMMLCGSGWVRKDESVGVQWIAATAFEQSHAKRLHLPPGGGPIKYLPGPKRGRPRKEKP